MTERERIKPVEPRGSDAREQQLSFDSSGRPVITWPQTDHLREPTEGRDEYGEALRVFAVLGLITLALVLSLVLAVVLNLTLF